MPGAGAADMPFGMPDESGYEPQESYFDGLDSAEGAEDLSADQEPLPFDEAGMPMDGSYADAAEAGEIPGMGYSGEGPFGPAYPEAEEISGTGNGTEENSVSGPSGANQHDDNKKPPTGGFFISSGAGDIFPDRNDRRGFSSCRACASCKRSSRSLP